MSVIMRSIVRTLLFLIVIVSSSFSAWADNGRVIAREDGAIIQVRDDDRGRNRGRGRGGDYRHEDRVIPLDTIINNLYAIYPGKPLDARGPMQRGERLVYEIIWLTPEGRQIVIIVDARTGQVLKVRGLG